MSTARSFFRAILLLAIAPALAGLPAQGYAAEDKVVIVTGGRMFFQKEGHVEPGRNPVLRCKETHSPRRPLLWSVPSRLTRR